MISIKIEKQKKTGEIKVVTNSKHKKASKKNNSDIPNHTANRMTDNENKETQNSDIRAQTQQRT